MWSEVVLSPRATPSTPNPTHISLRICSFRGVCGIEHSTKKKKKRQPFLDWPVEVL